MLQYIVRRVLLMIPTLIVISIISFTIIQLPPGDFLSAYVANLRQQGDSIDAEQIRALEEQYGLNQPVYVQYYKWMSGILLRGDWGRSFEWQKPVSELIWDRIGITMLISLLTILLSWAIAIPVGVYSATHQYSFLDYFMSFVSFFGLGTPSFLIALIALWVGLAMFGVNISGLFSERFLNQPWSVEKVLDMLSRIWLPVVILAIDNTASVIRTLRANMLDELNKPYVETARAKGVHETRLIWKYPVRVALNPFFSTVGWTLAALVSGETLVSVVLSYQTSGPLLLRALTSQDMYLAGSFVMLLSVMTVIGTLVSDILLAWADPRIRMEG
ncbi:MAG TPA: ABC transporter permease [Roseiflexaceae bacterium]|nr:ABC transporter permease [Roseiflexaceae bacterium]HMP40239.1 ABC transporter permease [Roseiflexaceae bacterium]